jgi:hypothetical protein
MAACLPQRHHWVAAVVTVVAGAAGLPACSGERVSSQPAATTSSPAGPTTRPSVAVLYAGYLSPAPLEPAQIQQALVKALAAKPEGRDIWFVLVRWHQRRDPSSWTAVVYFTPDEQTPRLRKGRCLYVSASEDDGESPTASELWRNLNPESPIPDPLNAYVQVSAANRPFGDKLDVPERALTPFPAPKDVEDSEVVEGVDFIRSAPKAKPETMTPRTFLYSMKYDASLPVCRIARKDAATLEIYTGWQVGILAGGGKWFQIRRTEGGYELVGAARWVS